MINIAQLLKDAPKGMKLYSPLFGEVKFVKIERQSDFPIVVTDCKGNGKSFTEYGVYFVDHPDAECLLFPSKDCRTWEGWKLPVKPKFKAGDWLVYNNGNCFAGGFSEAQVVKVKDGVYFFVSGTSGSFKFIDENCRLWTIEDAKDGDVITNGKLIVIFNKLEEPTYKQHIIAYVGLDLCGRLQITEDTWQLGVGLIFDKMKEAGYQWNPDKKELRKILPHYDIKNFHAGMPVLVRADNNCRWDYSVFSRITGNEDWKFAVCNGVSFIQCIPFEGNEHLLGTTDMCDEQYINW